MGWWHLFKSTEICERQKIVFFSGLFVFSLWPKSLLNKNNTNLLEQQINLFVDILKQVKIKTNKQTKHIRIFHAIEIFVCWFVLNRVIKCFQFKSNSYMYNYYYMYNFISTDQISVYERVGYLFELVLLLHVSFYCNRQAHFLNDSEINDNFHWKRNWTNVCFLPTPPPPPPADQDYLLNDFW